MAILTRSGGGVVVVVCTHCVLLSDLTYALSPTPLDHTPHRYKELGGAKKFHFRCYSLLRADMSAYVYQMAYVLTAGHDYTNNTNNTNKQDEDNDIMSLNRVITNLSVNKHLPGYPGQIPCDVKSEYPDVYKKLTKLWAAYITAAAPFMSNQRSPLHFDFFGIDVMANEVSLCLRFQGLFLYTIGILCNVK